MPVLLLDAVQTTSEICSSIGPSSVWIGLDSFCLTARTLQPGVDSQAAETNPGGIRTSSLTVDASSRSFGTRTVSTVSAPAGAALGRTLRRRACTGRAVNGGPATARHGAILRAVGPA